MSRPIRIAAADDEVDMRDYFWKVLPRLGYDVVSVASTGRAMPRVAPRLDHYGCQNARVDGIEAAMRLAHDTPVILVSAYHDPKLLERTGSDQIMAFLVKPIKQADWQPAITLALRRFRDRTGA